ncbi:MAG TPA: hypothetical protein DEA80_16315 [Afipia sp.]|nr:hypothetical protein [Afipia sp.]OUX62174.1 MAG: hypothetical protein CBB64_05000 [Afipia sp. TMED4]HAO39334.1 hypothetical protein [Afipia sp.]HAP13620.1 hypothetical protein [Afipia sp.]HAQ94473.1 hypothetical protein [Afipia sp.]
MRRVFLLIFLLQMTPSNAQSPLVEYRAALEYCAGRHMVEFDDGVSSAPVIARALFGVCRRENQKLFERAMAGQSRAYVTGYENAATEQFTTFVLMHRTRKSRP